MARPSRRHYLDAPVSETRPLIDEVQALSTTRSSSGWA